MNTKYPLHLAFYKTATGKEPVREWLITLRRNDRKIIGEDIKTIQFGWPIGMPLAKKIDTNLWEVRSNLDNRIARVIFTLHEEFIVLLHGFIKKTQKTPANDLRLAKQRMLSLRGK
jgi:phage-related protein